MTGHLSGGAGSSSMRTLYDVLGVAPSADACAIRSAFIALAKVHHPDRNPGSDGAARRFREISTAREILKDPESRAAYDAFLQTERQRSRRRLLRSAMAYSLVFGATFCAVFVGAKQHLAPPPAESVAATPAIPMHESAALAFAKASEDILVAVITQGSPKHRPAPPPGAGNRLAAVYGNETLPPPPREPVPPDEPYASEQLTRPIDTAANEPPAAAVEGAPREGAAPVLAALPGPVIDTAANDSTASPVDEPPRGGTAPVAAEMPERSILTARHDLDLPTGSIGPKLPVTMREVRVSAAYRDRKGVVRHVVRVFRVEHEGPDR
jgi:DnaJ domain